jgi:hypothetical protein
MKASGMPEIENGFTHVMSPAMARRQLQVSIVLLAAAFTAVAAGFLSAAVQPRYIEPKTVQLTIRAPENMDRRMAGIPRSTATHQN